MPSLSDIELHEIIGRGGFGLPPGLAPAVPPSPQCASGGKLYAPVAFVHINKAGGTAMRGLLLKYARHQLLEHLITELLLLNV